MNKKKKILSIIIAIIVVMIASNFYVMNKNNKKEEKNNEVVSNSIYHVKEGLIETNETITFTKKDEIIKIGPQLVKKDEYKGGFTISITSSTTMAKLKVEAYVDDKLVKEFYYETDSYDSGVIEVVPYDMGEKEKMELLVKFQYVDEKDVDSSSKYDVKILANDTP